MTIFTTRPSSVVFPMPSPHLILLLSSVFSLHCSRTSNPKTYHFILIRTRVLSSQIKERSLMASTSDQEPELNRSDGGWEAETSYACDIIKGETLDNLDPYLVGHDDMLRLPREIEPASEEPLEPHIGMEFESSDDAREFYEMYGLRTGFTIRNTRIRRSHKDNSIIGREFVCSREGFRAKKHLNRENRVLPPRPITREGCNAMLRVAIKDGSKWVISGFVREHNHELNPTKIPPRRFHRSIFSENEKDQKIRELSIELHRERRKCASYQEQLHMILKEIEEHTEHLSLRVENIVNNVRELESEEVLGDPQYI